MMPMLEYMLRDLSQMNGTAPEPEPDLVATALVALAERLEAALEGNRPLKAADYRPHLKSLVEAVGAPQEALVEAIKGIQVSPTVNVEAPQVSVEAPSVSVEVKRGERMIFEVRRGADRLITSIIARPYEDDDEDDGGLTVEME